MSTTQAAAVLYQLQQLDLELDRLVAERQTVATAMQGNAHLRKLRVDYEAAQQQVRAGLQTQKEAEWTLEDITQRLGLQEQRLYNGSVTSPKELQSLQQEVQRLRAQQIRQEDTVLDALDSTESLQGAAQKKQLELQQIEEKWQVEYTTLQKRCEQLDERQKEIQAKRHLLTATVAEDLLKRYEQMRRTKQGRAISKVDQNSCQWCRVILTPSELQRVRMSNELQTCTNCGRILYYDR